MPAVASTRAAAATTADVARDRRPRVRNEKDMGKDPHYGRKMIDLAVRERALACAHLGSSERPSEPIGRTVRQMA
jgi:hypothetical protein